MVLLSASLSRYLKYRHSSSVSPETLAGSQAPLVPSQVTYLPAHLDWCLLHIASSHTFVPHSQVPRALEYGSLHTSDSSAQTKEPSYSPDSSDILSPQLAAWSSWAVVHGPLQLSMWSLNLFMSVWKLFWEHAHCNIWEDTDSLSIWKFYFLLFYLLLFA